MTRRSFLNSAASAPVLLMSPAPPANSTRLFLDRRFASSSSGLELAIARCDTRTDPLPVDGRPILTRNNVHTIVDREADGSYSGWCLKMVPRPGASDARLMYAMRSPDGLAWSTSGEPIAAMGVIAVDHADRDPERRYKVLYQGWAELGPKGQLLRTLDISEWAAEGGRENTKLKRGIFSAVSPDGREWRDRRIVVTESLAPGARWWRPGEPGWAGGDNFPCLLQQPGSGKFVAYFRTNIDNGPNRRRERAIGLSESVDFKTWSPHRLALYARTEWRATMGDPMQDYYQIQAWPCAGIYLGVLSVFYWTQDRVHLELAWSPDGVNWDRVCPAADLIPHPAVSTTGGGCRYAAMRPQPDGDQVRVYYGEDNGRHNADKNREGSLRLATFRRDRFAGMRAKGNAEGEMLSAPFPIAGSALTLNADASRGEIRAALCDSDGQPLTGYDLGSFRPIQQDSLSASLTWRSEVSALRGRQIRLALQLRGASTAYALYERT